jgi:hypothetical protein
MPRYESEGTWFSKEAQAERDRWAQMHGRFKRMGFPHGDSTPRWPGPGEVIGHMYNRATGEIDTLRVPYPDGEVREVKPPGTKGNVAAMQYAVVADSNDSRFPPGRLVGIVYKTGRVVAVDPGGAVREVKPATKCVNHAPEGRSAYGEPLGYCFPTGWSIPYAHTPLAVEPCTP